MSTAPAPRAFEAFDEGFDVDLEFDAAPAGGPTEASHVPLAFSAAPEAAPTPGYNPVGAVMARAEASLAEPYPAAPTATAEPALATLAPTGLCLLYTSDAADE